MVIRRASNSNNDPAQPAPLPAQEAAPAIPSVSEFTRRLAGLLEGEFADVTVQGEISGWNRAASGHTYFTLKDDSAVLSGVLWRSRTLSHRVADGMKVVARGRITLYAPRGQYQLDCVSIVPVGLGDLQAAFERLKARLLAEGLFDAARKRPLPEFPRRIGVVTSSTGAAIRDILTTLERRMPSAEVVFRPALVQGVGAAEDVARAIREINDIGDVDVMIVGRGGGAIEDLWAFNEEVVARAIYNSRVPVISAVGHEIDFTIADFVADARAATPTAAAEIAVRDRADLLAWIADLHRALHDAAAAKLRSGTRDLAALVRSRGLARPLDIVRAYQQRLDDLSHRADLGLRSLARSAAERLQLAEATLRTLNPRNVLARGFAIVERDGAPVAHAAQLAPGDGVRIILQDGELAARIEEDGSDSTTTNTR